MLQKLYLFHGHLKELKKTVKKLAPYGVDGQLLRTAPP